ncbi:MAG: glucose-1-phosphate adenylyltransferase [Chthoniobacterales bacterium]
MSRKVLSLTKGTLAIIMGGGAGTRLFPLTKERSKPAVPLGGKYRLVDIPISNCLNSGIREMYVLTQFNTTSLHRHINDTYKFDGFSRSFVDILAAQQTPEGSDWYQGTADAVRQNMRYFLEGGYEHFIILSGDQLYRMDYRDILRQHIEREADITLGVIPVNRAAVPGFGIMHTDENKRVIEFVEKPKDPAVQDTLRIPKPILRSLGKSEDEELFQASMGIYVFNRSVLESCLDNDMADFGKNIIPSAIKSCKVDAYIFEGYWEDIGTIGAFFEANLALTNDEPAYNFYTGGFPTFTQPRFMPASVIRNATVKHSIVSDGSHLLGATLERCVIGIRSIIRENSTIKNTVMMGADYYDDDNPIIAQKSAEQPSIGIGRNCQIDHAIIDKNARIGDDVVITGEGKTEDSEGPGYYVRDGIVVIPKNSVIAPGTRI